MSWKQNNFFSGPAKQSAKGVTKDARRNMTHELFKRTLLGSEVVRLLTTRIASSNHRLHSIVFNKKSLSGYDDKRFILSDQVSTLPYGHNSLREDMFYKTILDEPDWGSLDASQNEQESTQQARDSSQQARDSSQQAQDSSQQARDSSQQAQDSSQQVQDSTQQARDSSQQAQGSTQHAQQRRKQNQQQKNKHPKQQPTTTIPQTRTIHNSSFNSPDPGFHQREYSEDELNEKVVDFDNLSQFLDSGSSTDAACDGFILSQAIEVSDSCPQPPITIDEQPPANLPITIEQQSLQDQPPSKKRRRARIIESNSEED